MGPASLFRRLRRSLVAVGVVMVVVGAPVPSPPDAAAAPSPGAVITGNLFADYNGDGSPLAGDGSVDPGETVPLGDSWTGFSITATDVLGGVSTGTIDPSGAYSLPTAGLEGDDFIVELTVPAGYQAAPNRVAGADTRPLLWHVTDLVTDRSGQNIGVAPPSSCPVSGGGADANANVAAGKLFTVCFASGDRSLATDVLVGINGDNSGAVEHLATAEEMGSLWSVAYDAYTGVLYTGSILKRHTELGPAGIDGLYWMDYSNGVTPSETVHSADLGPSYGTDPDRSGPNTNSVNVALPDEWTEDPLAWGLTGATGIGDIDLTPDGKRLLVMNLENKSLDVYDVTSIQADPATGSPVLLAQWPTPDPGCATVTTGAVTYADQPFAVTASDGATALVGVTCADASQAVVYAMAIADGSSATHFVLDGAYMASVRGCNWQRPCDTVPTFGQAVWEPWTADWQDMEDRAAVAGWDSNVRVVVRPAPLLADINVRADGSMDLSVIDRTSLAAGSNQASPDITTWNHLWITIAAGDLVHVCANGVMEGRAGCELAGSEFHVDDWINAVGGFHDEVQVGGAWSPNIGGRTVSAVFDPVDDDGVGANEWNSGGLHWYPDAEGTEVDARILYQNQAFDGFGKASGLGDVEGCLLPVAIGNRVWLDADIDGNQDPDEQGLAGATVTVTGGSLAGPIVVLTDAAGYWSVDSGDGLLAGETYTVTIDPATTTNLSAADLAALAETGAGMVGDGLDSDSVSGVATVDPLTPGETNHSYDSGWFVTPPSPPTTTTTTTTTTPTTTTTTPATTTTVPAGPVFDLALRKTLADGQTTDVAVGDLVTWEISVFNQGTVDATGIRLVDFVPANLALVDDDWTMGPSGATISLDGVTIVPGGVHRVEITTRILAAGELRNLAEIMAATAVDGTGTPLFDDGGLPLQDDDSSPDALSDDVLIDDITDNSGGDEDDHDVAVLTVPGTPGAPGDPNVPEPPPELAFTGLEARRIIGLGLLLLSLGGALEIGAIDGRRRTGLLILGPDRLPTRVS